MLASGLVCFCSKPKCCSFLCHRSPNCSPGEAAPDARVGKCQFLKTYNPDFSIPGKLCKSSKEEVFFTNYKLSQTCSPVIKYFTRMYRSIISVTFLNSAKFPC